MGVDTCTRVCRVSDRARQQRVIGSTTTYNRVQPGRRALLRRLRTGTLTGGFGPSRKPAVQRDGRQQ